MLFLALLISLHRGTFYLLLCCHLQHNKFEEFLYYLASQYFYDLLQCIGFLMQHQKHCGFVRHTSCLDSKKERYTWFSDFSCKNPCTSSACVATTISLNLAVAVALTQEVGCSDSAIADPTEYPLHQSNLHVQCTVKESSH